MAIVVCADISGTLIATILLSALLLLIAVVVVAYIIRRKLKQRAGKQRKGYFSVDVFNSLSFIIFSYTAGLSLGSF